MTRGGDLDRRMFLVAASATAGGLTLGFAVPFAESARGLGGAPEITCWIAIAPDETVTIRIARSEMGQGAMTGLAMLVAEELECNWSKVRTEFVSPSINLLKNRICGDTSTGASRSIASSQDNGKVLHRTSGRTLSFGALAPATARIKPPDPDNVALKPPSAWTLAGTPQRRLDVRDKVSGQPVYAIDVRLPNMLYAAVRHCPVFGGALLSVDENSIAEMAGVRGVVRMADAVAVVADSWWRAKRAVDALAVTWDDRGNGDVSTASIAAFVRAGLDTDAEVQIGRTDGDATAALARAAVRIEADYEVPFLAHATMEPQTCTAHVRADGVEIWVPTQDPATALATAAYAADVPHAKVRVHRTMLGGGFGRRAPIQEYVRQAVTIAKEFREPIKLIWSREQDIAHDRYRPFGMARLVAGLDEEGMPVALTIRLAGPSFVAALVSGFGSNVVVVQRIEDANLRDLRWRQSGGGASRGRCCLRARGGTPLARLRRNE